MENKRHSLCASAALSVGRPVLRVLAMLSPLLAAVFLIINNFLIVFGSKVLYV
jgi:hypothetical protein